MTSHHCNFFHLSFWKNEASSSSSLFIFWDKSVFTAAVVIDGLASFVQGWRLNPGCLRLMGNIGTIVASHFPLCKKKKETPLIYNSNAFISTNEDQCFEKLPIPTFPVFLHFGRKVQNIWKWMNHTTYCWERLWSKPGCLLIYVFININVILKDIFFTFGAEPKSSGFTSVVQIATWWWISEWLSWQQEMMTLSMLSVCLNLKNPYTGYSHCNYMIYYITKCIGVALLCLFSSFFNNSWNISAFVYTDKTCSRMNCCFLSFRELNGSNKRINQHQL